MTPERWQQIKSVWETAYLAPAAERGALLDRLCQGDADLRHEVEKLLSTGSGEALLRAVVGGAAARFQESRTELTGKALGPYQVHRLIGRGGMG